MWGGWRGGGRGRQPTEELGAGGHWLGLKAAQECGRSAGGKRQLQNPQAEAPQVGETPGPFLSVPLEMPIPLPPSRGWGPPHGATELEKSRLFANPLHLSVNSLWMPEVRDPALGPLEITYREACRWPSSGRT